MANGARTLYIGVTNDLMRRVWQHRTGSGSEFVAQYRLHQLVHAEEFEYVNDAITREKQLKGWTRAKKVALITSENPDWSDLSDGWFDS